MLELVAAFICLTSLLTYVNYRFIGLPPTIGVMVTALLFSLLLQGLSVLGYPGLEDRVQQLIGQIDFGDLLMNWMLGFLLFAGALHVNFNDVRSYRWPIGLLATVGVLIATTVIGSLVGLIAAYVGGFVDTVLMRIVDFILGFPTILVALVLLAMLGRGVDKVVIAIVVVQWAHYARIMRSRALQERRKEYIEAAQNLGFPAWRIMLRHLLPNCLGPVMVFATIQIANAIVLEATLSFLGVGVPITEPSLGLLIANGFQYLLSGDYWISMFPGLALLLLILAINVIADRLRAALDPRSP